MRKESEAAFGGFNSCSEGDVGFGNDERPGGRHESVFSAISAPLRFAFRVVMDRIQPETPRFVLVRQPNPILSAADEGGLDPKIRFP